MPSPSEQHDDLITKTQAHLTQHRQHRHTQADEQNVSILVYGFGTLIQAERPTKKNPHPPPPPPHEQHVLLRRRLQGSGAALHYHWDIPQLLPHQLPRDVRDNAAVDRIVHPFLKLTLKGTMPKFVGVPDEHLVQWGVLPATAATAAAATADAAAAPKPPPTVLVKCKLLDLGPALPMVRPEVAAVYRWRTVAEVRQGAGTMARMWGGDRECVVRLSETRYWLEEYPKVLEEARARLEDDGREAGVL
ncbi:hypothetical protein LTR65_006345 [Meristemomyces frigidus]